MNKKILIFGLVMILLSSFALALNSPVAFYPMTTNCVENTLGSDATNGGAFFVDANNGCDFEESETDYVDISNIVSANADDLEDGGYMCAWVTEESYGAYYTILGIGYDVNPTQQLVLISNLDNNQFTGRVYQQSGGLANLVPGTLNSGTPFSTYRHYCINWDSNGYVTNFWENNDDKGSSSTSSITLNNLNSGYIGAFPWISSTTGYYDGKIMGVLLGTGALSNTDVSTMYSGGRTYNPIVAFFELTASNLYNDSSITTFNATITNATTSQTISTSNSSIFWGLNDLVNITVRSLNYFEKTFTNINTSNDLEAELYQAALYTYAIQNYTNNTITNFNLTVGSQFNTSSSAYTTHYLNADTYSYTAKAEEHNYNSTGSLTFAALETKNITIGFVPFALNITAKEYFSNSSISNFTVQVISDYYTSNYSTTDGSLLVYGINGTYNLTIFTDNYASESELFDISEDGLNTTFYLYEKNSMYFQIYNQESGALISENVAITLIDDVGQTTYYTSNGTLFLNNISPDDYIITFESSSYSKATYYATVSQGSTQTLNAYLLNSTVLDSVTFTVKDLNGGSDLVSAVISISRVVGSEWVVINVLETDITGRAAFVYSTGEEYRFVISKSGYLDKSFSLNPILFETYTIKVEKDVSGISDTDYSGITIVYGPSIFYDATNNNITFLFADPTGSLEYYGYNYTYGSLIANNTGSNVYGEQFYDNITITGANYASFITLEYYYKTTTGSKKNFEFIYFISGIAAIDNSIVSNRGKTYGLGELERVFISDLIVIVVAGAAALFGGAIAAGLMAFAAFGYLMAIGFLNFWAGVISMIVLFILVTWRSSQ